MIFVGLCTIGWILIAIPVAGALMATVMSAGGANEIGDPNGKRLYVVHLAWFPVAIVSVIMGWVLTALDVANGVVIAVLLIPALHIIVFLALLSQLGKERS